MANVLDRQFDKLKIAIQEIYELKNSGQNVELKRSTSSAALQFVALKDSNRLIKRNIRAGRDNLHLEKSKVDISRLQLQNLLYEVSHLKKEICRCQKFESRDSHLDLLPDEDYSACISNDCSVKTDISSHKKHLYRLENELKLRKELDNQYNILRKSKRQFLQEIENQTQRYTSFAPALRTLIDSSKVLHDALQLSMDIEWKLSSVVKYLPKPLYIFFINLQSLQRVFNDLSFNAEIIGFESDAQMQEMLMARERASRQPAEHVQRRRYLRSEVNSSESMSGNSLHRELDPYPLHIRITIGSSDNAYQLFLIIYYWGRLKCVTAKAQLCNSSNINCQSDINFVQDLLGHLYPEDFGNDIPIPGIQYELQDLNIRSEECAEYLNKNGFGKPYCWLQNMCSIPTINCSKLYKHELNLHMFTREVIDRLKKRWNCWLQLTQQIRGLTLKDIDLYTLKENINSQALSCSLVQWTSISHEEFCNQNSDVLNVSDDNKGITYSSYRAVLVRGSAKMECFIRIPSNYPLERPLWILSVHWNGCHTSKNNSAIKMMEYWTNCLLPDQLDPNHRFLYAQLFRTIYSFDIFLETEGSMQSVVEYSKEKPFINPFTKRIRLRPYKYIKKGSANTFKQ